MAYKIIASDLDETLLGADQRVSEENWAAIRTLCSRGVEFVPATGRAFDEIPREIKESEWIRYYIVSDGTQIYDKKEGRTWEFAMDRATAKQVLDLVYRYPVLLTVHADTASYVEQATHNTESYKEFSMSDYWIDFLFLREKVMKGLKEFAYGQESLLSTVVFFKHMEDFHKARAALLQMPEIQLAQTAPNNLEIFSKKAGKGNALLLLASLLGVSPEETMALGDSTNDSTMIRAAGLGLAMANAVPELKAVADGVICHYEEDGIRYVLDHFFAL